MRPDIERGTDREILNVLEGIGRGGQDNLRWLREQMPPYFFISMRPEAETVAGLCLGLSRLATERHVVLADRDKTLMLARLDRPGSLYDTVRTLGRRDISYAEITHSFGNVPGTDHPLEFQRYRFDRKGDAEIAAAPVPEIPAAIRRAVRIELSESYPPVEPRVRDRLLRLLWLNDEEYVRTSPPRRIAQILWLFRQGRAHAGISLDVEDAAREAPAGRRESRVLLAVGNPPQKGFLAQVMEVFNRLDLGVRRAYALTLSTGVHPYFLGTFYVVRRDGGLLEKDSDLFRRLRRELHNTLILATDSPMYREFVLNGVMTGEEASLVNAFIGFCHTNLAHNCTDRYTFEDVVRAFHLHPDMALRLVRLFELRFDPDARDRDGRYGAALDEVAREIADYNTGHRGLDEFRKSIFRAALVFIRRTLKTNFFVPEKHALSFRLDPAYLDDLGPDATSDLPSDKPFRVTYFYGRNGLGYHIGFSDIARGGWRTLLTRSRDDFVTVANSLFRENFVLAHTQHLKNKDIYEGGSKMVVVVKLPDENVDEERKNQILHEVQYGFINAFLDILVTRNGKAADPNIVDYYGEDEPIELGPDENMHDGMIELIADLSRRRGYLLGNGIISSKALGINHKSYGVTSTGVMKFAEIAMREQGIDMRRDPFSVKFTGGPAGDVAGNAMRLLLSRCPEAQIRLIVDGSGALYDPAGVDHRELSRIVLARDIDAFDADKLSVGGFLLCRNVRRTEGLRQLYRRVARTELGREERWVTADEFHREYSGLLFTVPADLFIPAGGRPETIDRTNWERFFAADGTPTGRVIIEGANSFLSPEARTRLQERGVVVLRDASANKCGVISSSYEIIGNLLLTEKEFLANKEAYVADVLEILERRAIDEADLIFRRRRESGGKLSFTEISDALSREINAHDARLFDFFRSRPELPLAQPYRKALLAHLPRLVRDDPRYRMRLKRLPEKYRCAIVASEIASTIVYRGGFERNFESNLKDYLSRVFGGESGDAPEDRRVGG